MKRPTSLLVLLLLNACVAPPRPKLLSDVDAVRDSSSARESRQLVPQADARAEKLRSDAEAAWPEGQTASAEIYAERALVAYADARELARIVRAEQRLLATQAELHDAELALQKLDAQQKSAAAEAADLDAQLRVEREAERISDPKQTSPDREHARVVAAKTALSQARLLCVSARLLLGTKSPSEASLTAAMAAIADVEGKLTASKGKSPAPLPEAWAARSSCMQLLVTARRPAIAANPTSEKTDQLFVELAKAGFSPSRDDRGIVVTLTGAFAGNSLSNDVPQKLTELGRIAQQGDVPLLVVAHSGKGDPTPMDQKRAEAAAAALKTAGVATLESQAVGGRLPVALGSDLGGGRSNERLEMIFVTRL